jgi:uncharacterized protein
MTPETRLTVLLRTLTPKRMPGVYVYAISPEQRHDLDPVMMFREDAGWTLVLTRDRAEQAGLSWTFPCAMISLQVHSSLEAVGMIAAVAGALADAGIACNAVAAYHHDHLFVPLDHADEALVVLERLSRR